MKTTVILPEKKVRHFLQLMDALETKAKKYLSRELCEGVKLNVVDGELVLEVNDALPDFVQQVCELIFKCTLSQCWQLN